MSFNYKFQIGQIVWVNCFNRPTQVEVISFADNYFDIDGHYIVKAVGKEDWENFVASEDRLAKTKEEICDKYIAKVQKRVDYLKGEIATEEAKIKNWQAYKEERNV